MARQRKAARAGDVSGSGIDTAGTDHYPSGDSAAQRVRLLAMLRRSPVSTLDARAIGIMSPASRVLELRQRGYAILTYRHPRYRYGVYVLGGDHAID